MKKTILAIIFYLLILLNVFAQDNEAGKTTISAHYLLTSVHYSNKSMNTGSILTWRDSYLHGAYLNVNFQNAPSYFNRSNIGIGFSGSFNGYHTDDDANNDANVIYVSTPKISLLELKYEMLHRGSMINPKLGIDFNMLMFKNYDTRAFPRKNSGISSWWPEREGLRNTYDIYKLGYLAGVSVFFGNRVVYLEASGQIGMGFYFARANWLSNDNFKSPVSFLDIGTSFRGGSDVEVGLKLSVFTFFVKALIDFEINPGLGISLQFQSDDTLHIQPIFFELSRASFCAGLKVSF